MNNCKADSITCYLRDLEDYQVINLVNEYIGDEEHYIHNMDEFDDFCSDYLSYMETAEAVQDGDFHPWHNYFRYTEEGCFETSDEFCYLYDYDGDEDFAEWLCNGNVDLEDYGIKAELLINDYCSYYEIDKDKLVNHPNWEEHCIIDEDWDDLLDALDIEYNEVALNPEEDEEEEE